MIYKLFWNPNEAVLMDRLAQVVERRQLYASAPFSFNDPSEFKFQLDVEADHETARKRFFDDNPGRSKSDFQQWRRGLGQSKWSILQDARLKLLRGFGVICFSERVSNPILWSHYAGNHQGFAVAFDDSLLRSLNGVAACGPVAYADDPPVFRFFHDPPGQFAAVACLNKYSGWAYEEEVRIVLDRQGAIDLPAGSLCGVYLGCRAPQSLRRQARGYLNDPGVEVFQMAEDFSRYRLVHSLVEDDRFGMTSFF